MADDNVLGIPSAEEEEKRRVLPLNEAFRSPPVALEEAFGAPPKSNALDFLEVSRDTNPDDIARNRRLSEDLEMPRAVVDAAPEDAQRVRDRQMYMDIFRQAPATQRFLEADPEVAALSRDSVEQLGFIEGAANGLKRGIVNVEIGFNQYGAEGAREQTQDASRSFGEILATYGVEHQTGGKTKPVLGIDVHNPVDLLLATERWFSSRVFGSAEQQFRYRQGEVGRLIEERAALGMSDNAQKWMTGVEEANGILGKVAAAVSDPIGLAAFSTEVSAEVIPQLLVASAATAATRNPYMGSLVSGMASGSRERFNSAADFLQSAGVDLTDPEQVDALLLDDNLYTAAQNYGFTRGAIIGTMDAISGGIAGKALANNPMANLVLQAFAQGAFGGGGEALAQTATGEDIDINQVIFEAVGEFASTPIEVAGVGGRSLVTRLREVSAQGKAQATVEAMDKIVEASQNSPLTQRSPDAAAQHLASTLDEAGVSEVFMPVSALDDAIRDGTVPASILDDLGISKEDAARARTFDGDVRIDRTPFAQHVLQTPDSYTALRDHVRINEDALTQAEALESTEFNEELDRAASDLLAEGEPEASVVSRDTTAESTVSQETTNTVNIAEHEVGKYALFEDAKSAGLTDTEYQSYVEAHSEGRQKALTAKEKRKLRRDAKRASEEYVQKREAIRQQVEESVKQEPIYQALLSIGRDRLNQEQVLEAFNGDREQLKKLPKSNGRSIVAPQGEKGLDINVFAELNGFDSGDIFLYALQDSPRMEAVIEARLEARMHETDPTLMSDLAKIKEALEALHETDALGTMLNFELTQLRKKTGKLKLKRSLVKAKAMSVLDGYRIANISPSKLETLQRREARRARKEFRKGNLDAAAKHKFNQLVAYEATRQAYKIRQEVAVGTRYMAKFLNSRKRFKNVPIDHVEAIRQVLGSYQFGPTPRTSRNLQMWLDDRFQDGVVMDVSPDILNADGTKSLNHATLSEWRNVKNAVKEIEKAGRDANKLRQAQEGVFVSTVVEDIRKGIIENLDPRTDRAATRTVTQVEEVSRIRTMIDNAIDTKNRYGDAIGAMLLNTDSILRNLDGFQSLGTAYTYLKGGIDKAFTEGYGRIKINGEWVDRIGYIPRMKKESERLVAIIDTFDKKTRNRMGREVLIPGVSKRITYEQRVAALLNMGNADNIQAMVDANQFTEMELQAIVDSATKQELDYAQAVWDFLESFRPEIEATVRVRQNRVPTMVEAQTLSTPFGEYRGGYYPLSYDSSKAVLKGQQSVDEALKLQLKGGFVSSHTQDGHTQERVGSGGRPVRLDPHVVTNHLHQLIYDLEMGDAVTDAWKVLHNKEMKNAFSEIGRPDVHEALDIWFGDVVTGELRRNNLIENSFRTIRTGTTVSKLALNISTALLQPLGMLQSAVQVGKSNMVMGLYDLVSQNPIKTYQYVTEASGFMQERERSYNKDIHDAQRGLRNSWLKSVTPGNSADFIADALFLPITKMQRFVDIVTWLAAKRQGLQMFPGDDAKSTQHADRMVARTQGSGNFHERTNFERGTISREIRNTETIRAFSLFLNYFAAKLNVAYERTKTAKLNPVKNPIEFVDYASDMILLFAVEGVLAGVIKEGWPDEDEDPDDTWAKRIAWETAKNALAGVPVAREAVSAAEGFDTGGAIGSFFGGLARAGHQIGQGEADAAAFKSVNNVLGTLFKYPTSQVHRTGDAIYQASEGYDVEWWEYFMGYRKD